MTVTDAGHLASVSKVSRASNNNEYLEEAIGLRLECNAKGFDRGQWNINDVVKSFEDLGIMNCIRARMSFSTYRRPQIGSQFVQYTSLRLSLQYLHTANYDVLLWCIFL